MDLRTLLGADYKDGITVDEINTLLANRDLMDKSEAEKLANNRSAATQRLLDAANKKLAEATKRGTDTGNELADALARIATLEAENKDSKRNATIAANKATLIAQGYDDTLASETATAMADGDMSKVIENQGKFLVTQTQAIKDQLLRGTKPPAGGGSGAGGVDFKAGMAKAVQDGNDLEYLRLARLEMEQTSEN